MNFLKRKEDKKTFLVVWFEEKRVVLGVVDLEGEILAVQKERWEGEKKVEEALKTCFQRISFSKKVEGIFFLIPKKWALTDPREGLINLSQILGEKFLGFASHQEAVINFYKQKEGVAPNLILLGILGRRVEVFLVEKGEVVEEKEEKIEESLQESLKKALGGFSQKTLPPRVVIFTAVNSQVREEVLSYPFEESGLFLHLPRVYFLKDEDKIKAGGFLGKEKLEEEDRFGFVIGEDVSLKEEKEPVEKRVAPKESRFSFPSLFAKLKRPSLPSFSLPKLPRFSFPPLLFLGGVLLFFGLLFFLFPFFTKAKVLIFVHSQPLKKTEEVLVSSESFESSPSAQILKVGEIKVEVEGSLSGQATGEKLVGEKAKGKVIVYNKTLSPKTFPKGTKIVGPNGLKFTLDKSVSLDPATISTSAGSETKTYGRKEVDVTAEDIGTEYNLPGGIDFSILGFSSNLYSAHSDQGFSGGSSRKVTVVSKEDREALEKELIANLRKEAEEKLRGKVDEEVLKNALELEVEKKEFDHEVGEEAEMVSLSVKGVGKVLDVSFEKLKEFLLAKEEKEIPENLQLIPTQIKIQPHFKEKRGKVLAFAVDFEAKMVPVFKAEEVKKAIAGKSQKKAKSYLSSLPEVFDVQIKISPPLFQSFLPLPKKGENISLEIKPE